MVNNPIQFAVVREDPSWLIPLIEKMAPTRILMTASGGCTALSLKKTFPNISFDLYDLNPAQIEHVKNKVELLQQPDRKSLFNIGFVNPQGLNDCGNFEGLFRCLRDYLDEFVVTYEQFYEYFQQGDYDLNFINSITNNKYWDVSFDLFFNNKFLDAMFGPQATQHAEPGSYSIYFKSLLESALKEKKEMNNYFLHHVFLGHYIESCLPLYLQPGESNLNFEYLNQSIDSLKDLSEYQLIDFSNIFDWSDNESIAKVAKKCNEEMKSNSMIVFRQLNNSSDLMSAFREHFDFEEAKSYLNKPKDLFYNQYNVGIKK
jgi:S-adenosylmethionine-diacylglycerol 3-amino-3-carboxypropyl transferase